MLGDLNNSRKCLWQSAYISPALYDCELIIVMYWWGHGLETLFGQPLI